MQFIDTHIHLQDFNEDFALEILENRGVEAMLLVAAKYEDWEKICKWSKKYPDKLYGALGIHPWYCDEFDENIYEELLKNLENNPKMLVGEIGVDALKNPVTEKQHKVFSWQLDIAKKLNRPVIIHAAKAFEALKIHKKELCEVKFSYHGFVKNRELIKFINECNGYFGLSALFLRQVNAKDFWDMMPKNRVLFETDAPYQVDENGYLETVEKNMLKLVEISGMECGDLENLLKRNAMEFLDVGR